MKLRVHVGVTCLPGDEIALRLCRAHLELLDAMVRLRELECLCRLMLSEFIRERVQRVLRRSQFLLACDTTFLGFRALRTCLLHGRALRSGHIDHIARHLRLQYRDRPLQDRFMLLRQGELTRELINLVPCA